MAAEDQLAALLERNGALFTTYEGWANAQTMLLAGTLDDPDSFNAEGGKTGALGYYPVINVSGQTIYVPCIDRINAGVVDVEDRLSGVNGASLVGFAQGVSGAIGRQVSSKLGEAISVLDFGAVGNGVADDAPAIQAAANWLCGANNRLLTFPAGYRFRIATGVVFDFAGGVGGQIVMYSPITPDAGVAEAFRIKDGRDLSGRLMVRGGGADADYMIANPAGGTEAFVFSGTRKPHFEIYATSYLGRVLRTRTGGYYKLSYCDFSITSGDRPEAINAVQIGQACYLEDDGSAFGRIGKLDSAWSKYGPVFYNVVDIVVDYAEIGALNGVNSPWKFRGCGSVWLGTILGGDETSIHSMLEFDNDDVGNGCRRVYIDLLFAVQPKNALVAKNFVGDADGLTINKLVCTSSAEEVIVLENMARAKINHISGRACYRIAKISGNCGHIDIVIDAINTKREAVLVAAGTTGTIRLGGLSLEAGSEAAATYAHIRNESTACRLDLIDLNLKGAVNPLGCCDLVAGSTVRAFGGRWETAAKFVGQGAECVEIDHVQGLVNNVWMTVTIPSGQTSVTVPHGMFAIPSYGTLGPTHAEVAGATLTVSSANITVAVANAVTANRNVHVHIVRRP